MANFGRIKPAQLAALKPPKKAGADPENVTKILKALKNKIINPGS